MKIQLIKITNEISALDVFDSSSLPIYSRDTMPSIKGLQHFSYLRSCKTFDTRLAKRTQSSWYNLRGHVSEVGGILFWKDASLTLAALTELFLSDLATVNHQHQHQQRIR